MMYATKLKMKSGRMDSDDLLEIDEIYIDQWSCYHTKEYIHDYVEANPKTIAVDISPYRTLIPEIIFRGEKYVRSNPDSTSQDDLLRLPKE